MKKSLLLILSAALLLVGCSKELETKVTDLTNQVANLEKQVAANKAAIEVLQKCDFIKSVEATPTGWLINTNTQTLAIYNGKDGQDGQDGKDGDAFFQSVEVGEESVAFTLVDGTSFVIPIFVEFEFQVISKEATIKPATENHIPFRVIGQTEKTEVYASASAPYKVEVDKAAGELIVTAPAEIVAGNILVIADRGDGKTSAKLISLEALQFTVSSTASGHFWGETAAVPVVSNVPVTFETDVNWLTLSVSKATETYTLNIASSSSYSTDVKVAHIYAKDADGEILQTITYTKEALSGKYLVGPTNWAYYPTWADAKAAIMAGSHSTGEITIHVAEGSTVADEIVDLPEVSGITKYILRANKFGAYQADKKHTIIRELEVYNTNVDVLGLTIAGTQFNTLKKQEGFDYGCNILLKGAGKTYNFNDVDITCDADMAAASNTCIFTPGTNDKGALNFTNVNFNFGGCRGMQLYGTDSMTLDGCVLANAYASYAIRLYPTFGDVTMKNCIGDTPKIFNARSGYAGTLKYDEGNAYTENCKYIVDFQDEAKADIPATPSEGNVLCKGVAFQTVQAAIDYASAGETIELKAGTFEENVKVAFGKDVIIKAAAGVAAAEAVIVGNVEISGNAVFEGVTIQTKKGVTNSACTVKQNGEGYDWGNIYVVRVEKGAGNVTLENCVITAEEELDALTASLLWISDASGKVVVNGCTFNAGEKGAYCVNQTHTSTVEFTNNVFNGGGSESWAIRPMDRSKVTIAGNIFNEIKYPVQVYKDFSGRLVLGDGVEDDNYYGAGTVFAIAASNGEPKSTFVFQGAKVLPGKTIFNNRTSDGGLVKHALSKVWYHIDEAEFAATNCRNMAMNADGMYFVEAGAAAKNAYKLSMEDGSLVKTAALGDETPAGQFFMDGMTSLDDGTVIVSNLVICNGSGNNGKHNFKMWTLDKDLAFTEICNIKAEHGDGGPRIGDMISSTGTMADGMVYAVDYPYPSGRIWAFSLKDGKFTPVRQEGKNYENPCSWYNSGLSAAPNINTVTPYLNDVTANNFIWTSHLGTFILNTKPWAGKITKTVVLADIAKTSTVRNAKFFTVGEEDFMALLELTNTASSNSKGAVVRVYALPTKSLDADLDGAKAIASYEVPSETANPNCCGRLDVLQKDSKTFIGVGIQNTGAALFEFL